jgi:exonuclease III
VTKLTIGTWNVRTLLDNVHADKSTDVAANELAQYNINIAALQETRFAEERQLTDKGADYTFFWSGRKQDERREAGVGFAIRSNLVKNLESLPKGFNDRLMVMQLPLPVGKKASLISAHAPTMTNPGKAKDKIDEVFNSLLPSIPKEHKLLVVGVSMSELDVTIGLGRVPWANMTEARPTPTVSSCFKPAAYTP